MEKGKLVDYCSSKGISMERLSEITGISLPQLYLINSDTRYNAKVQTVNKIFLKTKKEFGDGLSANKYLDHECLKNCEM